MPYKLIGNPEFLAELNSLDKSIRELVAKKLIKIKENPRLSKPLEYAPNHYSERVKNFRIVFKIVGDCVILYHIKKRKEAYGEP